MVSLRVPNLDALSDEDAGQLENFLQVFGDGRLKAMVVLSELLHHPGLIEVLRERAITWHGSPVAATIS